MLRKLMERRELAPPQEFSYAGYKISILRRVPQALKDEIDKQLQNELHQSLHDRKKRKDLIYKQIREQMGHLGREEQAKIYALMLPFPVTRLEGRRGWYANALHVAAWMNRAFPADEEGRTPMT